MEDKILQLIKLKEEYCKWYCEYRNKELEVKCDNDPYCSYCDADAICESSVDVNLCKHCQVNNFIQYINKEV